MNKEQEILNTLRAFKTTQDTLLAQVKVYFDRINAQGNQIELLNIEMAQLKKFLGPRGVK